MAIQTNSEMLANRSTEHISVKDRGAVGDGVTNDTAAIQLALNSGKSWILIPEGTFIVDSLTVPSSVRVLYGNGTIKHKDNATGNLFTLPDSSATYSGFKIDGNKDNQSSRYDIFRISSLSNKDLRFSGITNSNSVASCWFVDEMTNNSTLRITGCNILEPAESTSDTSVSYPNQSLGLYIQQATDAFVEVDRCTFKKSGTITNLKRQCSSIQVRGKGLTSTGLGISASGTTLTDSNNGFTEDHVGFWVRVEGAGASGGQLFSRIASFTNTGEVEIEDAASTTVAGATGYWATDRFRITVSNSYFYQMGNEANPSAPIDVYAFGTNVNIFKNTIEKPAYGGIRVANSYSPIIQDNTVKGALTDQGGAIKFQGAVRSDYAAVYNYPKITGNTIEDDASLLGGISVIGDFNGDRYLQGVEICGNTIVRCEGGIYLDGVGKATIDGNVIDEVLHTGSTLAGLYAKRSVGPITASGGSISNSGTYGAYVPSGTSNMEITFRGIDFSANTGQHIRIDDSTVSAKFFSNQFFGSTPTQVIRATCALVVMRLNEAPIGSTVFTTGATTVKRSQNSFDLFEGSATWNPASISNGSRSKLTIVDSNAELGDYITAVSFSLDPQNMTLTGLVRAAGTIDITFTNNTGGAVDLAEGTVRYLLQKAGTV